MTSLAELAAAACRYARLERRLFEVLGRWVASTPEPEVKLLLRAHSFQHAWHAELWDELAPRTGPVGVAVAGEGAGGTDAELVSVMNALAESGTTVERLTAAYQVVLPRLVQAYRDAVAAATPASDGPLARALGLMLADDEAAIGTGQSLLARLVGTTEGEGDRPLPHVSEGHGIASHTEHPQPLKWVEPSGGG